MILLLLVAVLGGVALFIAFLPKGVVAALVAASLGGSALTALVAVVLAAWKSRNAPRDKPARSARPEPRSAPLDRAETP